MGPLKLYYLLLFLPPQQGIGRVDPPLLQQKRPHGPDWHLERTVSAQPKQEKCVFHK